MTTLTLSKWGNAEGVRIPKSIREQVGLKDGEQVEATVRNGSIILKPVRTNMRVIHVTNLDDLFKNRSEPYRASEDPFGAPVGEEAL